MNSIRVIWDASLTNRQKVSQAGPIGHQPGFNRSDRDSEPHQRARLTEVRNDKGPNTVRLVVEVHKGDKADVARGLVVSGQALQYLMPAT